MVQCKGPETEIHTYVERILFSRNGTGKLYNHIQKKRKTDREKEGTKEGRKKVRKGGKERGEGKSMGGREGGTYKQIILAHNAQYAKKHIYIKPVTKIRYKVGKII